MVMGTPVKYISGSLFLRIVIIFSHGIILCELYPGRITGRNNLYSTVGRREPPDIRDNTGSRSARFSGEREEDGGR